MGYARRYTEHEIAKFLKDSEGSMPDGGAASGHAESSHELRSVGRHRKSTTVEAMTRRSLDERLPGVGAFDGNQVQAVTFALNTHAGQNALIYLNGAKVTSIYCEIDVSSQGFKMKTVVAQVPRIGPINFPAVHDHTAATVCMKLIPHQRTIHIRTAFPRAMPSARGEHCEIRYVNDGGIPVQTVPI